MFIYRCAGCGAVNRTPRTAPSPQGCSLCRRLLDTSGRPQSVDAAALVSAIRSSPAPVLVDFDGRGANGAAVDGVAREHAGDLLVLRIDPGEERAAAVAFQVLTTPTQVLFSGGSEVSRLSGAAAADLASWLEATAALPA